MCSSLFDTSLSGALDDGGIIELALAKDSEDNVPIYTLILILENEKCTQRKHGALRPQKPLRLITVSYTHLTLPTRRTV